MARLRRGDVLLDELFSTAIADVLWLSVCRVRVLPGEPDAPGKGRSLFLSRWEALLGHPATRLGSVVYYHSAGKQHRSSGSRVTKEKSRRRGDLSRGRV